MLSVKNARNQRINIAQPCIPIQADFVEHWIRGRIFYAG